jgi:aspartate aminotransferase-like enzyme
VSPNIDAAAYAEAERSLAVLLATERDVTILQGEAILLLEAVARGLGGPGVRALNLVSGPYGEALGDWLAVGGAEVTHLAVEFDRALPVDAVRDALARAPFDVVSVVHAEAATGVVNPLAEISALVHEAGAVLAVDAVASVGADPLEIDAWDLDLVMLGTQKALGGPNGVCALVASERGWAQIAANPQAPRESILSLLDWKERWLDTGRQRIPGYAYEHEMRALIGALEALEGDVGLVGVVDRHRRAAAALRAAAGPLGLEPWVAVEAEAAGVVTLLRPPDGLSVRQLVAASAEWADAGLIIPAPGPLAEQTLRVSHTGPAATPAGVLGAVTALGAGLSQLGLAPEMGAALRAASGALTALPRT